MHTKVYYITITEIKIIFTILIKFLLLNKVNSNRPNENLQVLIIIFNKKNEL